MLKEDINHYIAMKRAMGFKYRIQSRLLLLFLAFAQERGDTCVRNNTVLEWAGLAPSPAQRRNRLLTVRRFAVTMQSSERPHELPPANAFGRGSGERRIPYIFSSEDIGQLIRAAAQLKPQETIRPKTYTTLFALLATTGIRVSEALALNMEDLTEDGLIIKSTKFRKDRLVPLHVSTQQGITSYLKYRTKFCTVNESALLISNKGIRLPYPTVAATFLQLMRSAGLRGAPGSPGPCIHDLRHTFAVKSLEQCTGDHTTISRHMTALSTYLGHAHISDTYWYLQATPRLLKQIAVLQESCYKEVCNE